MWRRAVYFFLERKDATMGRPRAVSDETILLAAHRSIASDAGASILPKLALFFLYSSELDLQYSIVN